MLNLTLEPVTSGFSLLPFEITVNVGMQETWFQITVPQDIAQGLYVLSWNKINDEVPAIYTPIKDTIVLVDSSS